MTQSIDVNDKGERMGTDCQGMTITRRTTSDGGSNNSQKRILSPKERAKPQMKIS